MPFFWKKKSSEDEERVRFRRFLGKWQELLAIGPAQQAGHSRISLLTGGSEKAAAPGQALQKLPRRKLDDFLASLPAELELGRRVVEDAVNGSEAGFLVEVLCGLPKPPAGGTAVPADGNVPWATLEAACGDIAAVVNRFRLPELQDATGREQARADGLGERYKELRSILSGAENERKRRKFELQSDLRSWRAYEAEWGKNNRNLQREVADARAQYEAALAEQSAAAGKFDQAHPEFRDCVRALTVLHELYRFANDRLLNLRTPEADAALVVLLRSTDLARKNLAIEMLRQHNWQPKTLEEKLDFYCPQAKAEGPGSAAYGHLASAVKQGQDEAELLDAIEPRLVQEGLTELRTFLLARLVELGGTRAWPHLVAVFGSHTEPVTLRVEAVRLAASGGRTEAVPLLVEALADPETAVRGAAIEALASFTVGPGHPQHGELLARLVHLLRDGEPVIRESAGRTLRQYPGAAEHVARVLVEDANPSAREEAAETLRRKFEPSESSVRSLIKALGDEVAAVRRAAQRALAAYHRVPDSGEDLFRYLGAKQDWDGLSRQGPAAVSYLAGLLRDRDEEVRLKAVRTLGTVRDPGSAGDVSALLSDPSQDVRKETARVLARLGNAGVVAALKSARLKEGFEDVRKELDSAISRLGGEA